jgi:arsenite methyltransferase
MLAKARENASKAAVHNTSFISSRITAIDIPDATADVVISNCVINLVPHTEKHSVFKEIFRLLRPGGRLAISDILTKKGLPEQMKTNLALYVGCIAGASRKEDYERWLKDAGFSEIVIVDSAVDLNVYTQTTDKGIDSAECCGPGTAKESHASSQESGEYYASKNTAASVVEGMKTRFEDMDLNQWAG